MMYAWVDNPEHDNLSNAQAYRNGAAEKEGHYFLRIAIPYIKSLREGKSKKEAFEIAYGDIPYLADYKIDNEIIRQR